MMKRIHILLFASLILASCSSEPAGPSAAVAVPGPEAEEVNTSSLVPGQMIVEFSDQMTELIEADLRSGAFLQTRSAAVNSVLSSLGATRVERLYPDAGEWEPRHREAGLHRWYKIEFDKGLPQTRAVADVAAIPGIEYAEPVRRVKSTAIFNDPQLGRQWHYINDGTKGANHKKGCDINVEPVWRNFTGGSSEVIVAIVDGGIDLSHEDLSAVCIPGGSNGSKNMVSSSFQIVPHDHGTHVAGTVGAVNNNGIGVCGVAGGLDGKGGVRLMSCQVFEPNPDDPEHDKSGGFQEALVWAADHGAVIANNSWGNVYDKEEDALASGVGSMKGAIDYFVKNAGTDKNGNQTGPMKGGLVVFAAGNEGWKIGWPAAYEGVVAVGAVAPDFTRASYSNYGDWVDIAAPGGAAEYDNGEILSTIPGNKYIAYQGTSMACPHVAGVAALIVSQFGGPGFTCDMLKERLLGGANPNVLSRASQIGPLVDVLGAFSFGSKEPPVAVSGHSLEVKSNFLTFKWKTTKDPDDKIAYGYMLFASKDRSLLENLDCRNIPSAVKYAVVLGGDLKAGQDIEGVLSGLEFNTEYFTGIVAYDYSNNYSAISPIVAVTTLSNTPPSIVSDHSGSIVLKAFENANVDFSISDPDGHSYSINLTPGSSAVEAVKFSDKYRLVFTGKNADAGKYAAVLTVTDEFGAASSYTVDYQILPNNPPVSDKDPDNLIFESIGERMTLEMENYVSDPDGEQLTYSISTSPVGIVHLNQTDDILNLTTLDYGLAAVTITGSDIKGETATVSLKVLVRDPAAEPDVYPTQVKSTLNIHDGSEKTLHIVISNSAGAVMFDQTVTCDAFDPAVIDMTGWAPGTYGVSVTSDGATVKRTIVKL